ncbi:MAG: hypothetical protein HUU35_19595 [Armatimonadetes bacterium]|nr:hypothetical protein [Armatimonadota bacterium]
MAQAPLDRDGAIARAAEFGVSEATAGAVAEAFERLAARTGRAFEPAAWSHTVWLAEADRYERSRDRESHFTLLLHLEGLREQFEERVERGARGFGKGVNGQRLTKR